MGGAAGSKYRCAVFGLGRKKRESERVYIEVWCCAESCTPAPVGRGGSWTFRVHGEDFTVEPDGCSEVSAEDAAAMGRALCQRLGLRVTDVEITSDAETEG
jgi:hypothetical protein